MKKKILDFKIILLFISVIIISVILLVFKKNNYINCESSNFLIISTKNQVNEVITFIDDTPNAKKWEWDFGDSTKIETTKEAFHKYKNKGYYTISLKINGNCTVQKTIEIKDLGAIKNTSKIPTIISPKIVEVGEKFSLGYSYIETNIPFSWEWSFGESGQSDNTSEFPVYSYSTPGMKKISLIINGDVEHMAQSTIIVKPRKLIRVNNGIDTLYSHKKKEDVFKKPFQDVGIDPLEEFISQIPAMPSKKEGKTEEFKKVMTPDISENQFELLLLEVAKQAKTKEDFGKYMKNNYEIPVLINNKEIITFSKFCENIKGKTIKIDALKLYKDNKNTITNINVNYKVKKFFIWIKE